MYKLVSKFGIKAPNHLYKRRLLSLIVGSLIVDCSFLYTLHKQQFLELVERAEVQKVPASYVGSALIVAHLFRRLLD